MTGECIPCNDAERTPKNASEEGQSLKLKELELNSLAWLILFGIGGLILALYYANIGYFPQIKWEESLAYLGVMAMAGFFLTSLFSLLLYVPGLIWCKYLLCDPLLAKLFWYTSPEPKQDNPKTACKPQPKLCLRGALLYIVLPFAIHMIVLHSVLNSTQIDEPEALLLGSASLFSTSFFFWVLLEEKLVPGKTGSASDLVRTDQTGAIQDPDKDALKRDLFRHAGFFFFSSTLSSFSVWVIHRLHVPSPQYFKLAVACTATVVVVNLFVALIHEPERRQAFGIAVAGAFALLIFGDLLVDERCARFSMRLLSHYGVGFDNPATLIVTEDGCRLLKAQVSGPPCTKALAPYRFDRVEILSRLGSEYFLRIQGRSLALPQKDVLSWSMLDKKSRPIGQHRVECPP